MKIDQQTVVGADGSSVDCGHFNNGLYSTYLQLCAKIKKGTQYILHGYIKSNKNGTIICEDASAEVKTEWTHVEMVVIPTSDNLEVCFYPGEFWLYNWKLEIGSTASDWTPSPLDAKYDLISIGSTIEQLSDKITQKVWQEDINNATGEIEKKYAQTVIDANKINWIVASGEDMSNMTLTKDFYTIVSKNIDITGKVTFDSFSSALQTRWDDLNDTANNADEVAAEAKSTANDIIDNIYTTNTTTIDGGKITTNSITADKLNVNDLTAVGASIAGWKIDNTNGIYSEYLDSSTNIIYTTKISADTPYNFGVYAGDEPNFYVSRNGFLYAKDCRLLGDIIASSGKIGEFNISDGILSSTPSTYLLPDRDVFLTIREAILAANAGESANLPLDLYDFNTDGTIDIVDFGRVKRYLIGVSSENDFKNWKYAKKSSVIFEINPQNAKKAVFLSAEDMWGKERKTQIGIGSIYSNEIECINLKVKDPISHNAYGSVNYPIENLNFRETSTNNSTELFNKSYKISGCGMLIINCSIWTDETSDYGTISCAIYIDGACVNANRHRTESANAVELDAGCSFSWWFCDDTEHTLQIIAGSTKNGTKTYTQSIQALFGLTVS